MILNYLDKSEANVQRIFIVYRTLSELIFKIYSRILEEKKIGKRRIPT